MSAPVRVLVVDDSAVIRQLLTGLLSEDPEIEVVGSAPDPFVARERIKELNPDVITLDIEMPRMDGFELTRQIRGSDRFRDLPVVLITGLDSQRDKERGVAAGANAYLVKRDFDQRNLIDAIGRLV